MKIYVASSWRNGQQQDVVKALRIAGHEVYDFKNPSETDKGFSWSDIDPNWQNWTNEQYRLALQHPIAQKAFDNDFNAMKWADACVMVMPCGRSAHVEAGWMQGAGKPTIVLQPQEAEAELMYKMFINVFPEIESVLFALAVIENDVVFLPQVNDISVNDADEVTLLCVDCNKVPVDYPDGTCNGCFDKFLNENQP